MVEKFQIRVIERYVSKVYDPSIYTTSWPWTRTYNIIFKVT